MTEVQITIQLPDQAESIDQLEAVKISTTEAAASRNKPEFNVELGQYVVELYLESNGIEGMYYVNHAFSDKKTTLFVIANIDHPIFHHNDPEQAVLNVKHIVYDALSEHLSGQVNRSDHLTVNAMKDRLLRVPWKQQNQ